MTSENCCQFIEFLCYIKYLAVKHLPFVTVNYQLLYTICIEYLWCGITIILGTSANGLKLPISSIGFQPPPSYCCDTHSYCHLLLPILCKQTDNGNCRYLCNVHIGYYIVYLCEGTGGTKLISIKIFMC